MFNLQARLSLRDDFTSPMRRVSRQIQQNQRSIERLTRAHEENGRSTSRATRAAEHFTNALRGVGGASKGIFSLKGAFVGLAAAIGGAKAAQSLFNKTIGEAAKFEQSSVMIDALFNDKKASSKYQKMLTDMAIKSPVFNSADMFDNSKSFITLTKNTNELQKMWKLAERMAAIDPMQGVEGSVMALRELFSGDATSMVERFEMPRKVMNEIKGMDLPEQVRALNRYFNSIGMTEKIIKDAGGTTLGIWSQITEAVDKMLREMGQPALSVIKKFLGEINKGISGGDLSGFQQTGANILKNVATGFVAAAKGIGKWISSIQNNAEFQKQTTLFGRVKWVIEDLFNKFNEWLDNGGRDKIANTSKALVEILAATIEASADTLTPIAVNLGSAIGSGIVSGVNEALKSSWILQMLADPQSAVKWAKQKATTIIAKKVWGVSHSGSKSSTPSSSTKGVNPYGVRTNGPLPSHHGGLNRVPYDGYVARLHKNEKVVPASQVKDYEKGGNVYQFGDIHINGTGSSKKDADKLFEYFVKKIETAGGAGA